MTRLPPLGAGVVSACMSGCAGVQSALAPAGVEAAAIATLTWWLLGGAAVIWCGVVALATFASRKRTVEGDSAEPRTPGHQNVPDAVRRRETRHARMLILGGGVVFPIVTLAIVLLVGLRMTPALLAADGDVSIDVIGEQWWWRVRYAGPDGATVETANEIRLPVGRRSTFHVEAADVIHSFWVPALGGKIDMLPGRSNVLTVEPTATGVYRGVCAEFCGLSHALMAFDVVVMEQQEFADWVRRQSEDAAPPESASARRGQRLFLDSGCGACHRIRGTDATGRVGPDLTHVGSRRSVGAGTLPMAETSLAEWIREPAQFKPGVEMPAYHMLAAADAAALTEYLRGLE